VRAGDQSRSHYRPVRDDVFEKSGRIVAERFGGGFPVSEALIMSGQLPQFKSHFGVAGVRVYPIQTREARHSGPEIRG
jgi:hypothetical protein